MTALFQISKGLMYDRTCNSIKSEQNTGVNTQEPFQKYILQDVNWLKLNEPSLIKKINGGGVMWLTLGLSLQRGT